MDAMLAVTSPESQLELGLVEKLLDLKFEHRSDIRDRASLEKNFRDKFQALNQVKLTDAKFARLPDEIVTSDVYAASKTLRSINSFTWENGTPLNYTLVNVKDLCKNTFEAVGQKRINTDNSHYYKYDLNRDVLPLINDVPATQIVVKSLGINPHRLLHGSMEQSVSYKTDVFSSTFSVARKLWL